VPVQKREQQLERLDAHTRIPLRQHIRAQRHRRPHDRNRERLTDAGRMDCATD
jgi:hypothetical protein